MSFFVTKFDTQVAIYETVGSSSLTGFRSHTTVEALPSTENTIHGFQFDRFTWRTEEEKNENFVVPNLWDSSIGSVSLRSGIGDKEDLLIEEINSEKFNDKNTWHPKVNHGYYYDKDQERYLFSDDSLVVYPSRDQVVISLLDSTISGGNYVDLQFNPKPGIPIIAKSYQWIKREASFRVYEEAEKKVQFSSKASDTELVTVLGDEIIWSNLDNSHKEFILDYNFSPPRIIFNKQVIESVGRILVDSTNLEELEAMELVGIASADDSQQFHLEFSPVDRTAGVQVIVVSGSNVQQYTVVSGLQVGQTNEVVVDYDLGILKFGSASIGGNPGLGTTIYAAYNKTIAIEYEPERSRDYAQNVDADLNPIRHSNANGFVFVKQHSIQDVHSIVLSAELPEISSNYFGPLFNGNNFANIVAKVLDSDGNPVSGIEVTFEKVNSPTNVTFGSSQSASAISTDNGQARTLLNPPITIDNMGGATNTLFSGISGTQLFIPDYTPPDLSQSLYLFQVQAVDNILGIPKASLLNYYQDYVTGEGANASIVRGPVITWNIDGDTSWISGALSSFIKWELLYRELYGLATPITYDPSDLVTGKKTVVAVLDNSSVNPHTGTTPAFIPLQPISYTITSSGTFVDFDRTLPGIDSNIKSYLVVGPEKVTVRAHAKNPLNGTIVTSNDIDILISISSSSSGLMSVTSLGAVPPTLLGNAYLDDQDGTPLDPITISSTGLLPLGWRLTSTGITLASALDSITFLDINPLAWDGDSGATISYSFTIV